MKGAINALLIVCITVLSFLCPKSTCETPHLAAQRGSLGASDDNFDSFARFETTFV